MNEDLKSNPSVIKSLDLSWKEGIWAQIMLNIMEYYLVPFALFMGAATHQIGLMVSLPHLLASVALLFAVRMVRLAGSRLRFLVKGAAFQALTLLPIACLALVPAPGRVPVLIALVILFRITGNFIGAAWGSLTSDYLPPDKRGAYFGWRSQVVGIVGLFGVIVGGIVLFLAKKTVPAAGFFLLFAAAAFCRMNSVFLFSKMADLPLRHKPEDDFTFFMFLRRFKESNFVKYVLFVSCLTFTVQLASPYFSVFMLEDLKFNYLKYMSVHLAAVVTGLVSFPIWGRLADRVGNAKILRITSFLIPVIPLLWILGRNFYYLVAVEGFSGFIWGGFNLCAINFIYDAVSPEKRVRCLGYFNLLNGIAIFLGAWLGGHLADRLPAIAGYSLYTLFLLSALGRMAVHFFLARSFREVRVNAEKIPSSKLFFSVVGMLPWIGGSPVNLMPFTKKPVIFRDQNF